MKILTFDIEEWFHILDNPDTRSIESWARYPSRLKEGVDTILELLEETNQTATFFCLGWVAERHPEVIRQIDRAGHHIGTHSYSHQLAYEQSPDEFRNDLRKSISILADMLGKPINCYRAPGFSITSQNLWAFEILLEQGIEIDCSLFPANRAHGGLPDFKAACPTRGILDERQLMLFPINTRTILRNKVIYSGGGYFRLLPGPLLKHWFKRDDYVMTYFHPRDFDSEQPLIPGLNWQRRFKSYVGIRGAREKLKTILTRSRFCNVLEASTMTNWEEAPAVDLLTGSAI